MFGRTPCARDSNREGGQLLERPEVHNWLCLYSLLNHIRCVLPVAGAGGGGSARADAVRARHPRDGARAHAAPQVRPAVGTGVLHLAAVTVLHLPALNKVLPFGRTSVLACSAALLPCLLQHWNTLRGALCRASALPTDAAFAGAGSGGCSTWWRLMRPMPSWPTCPPYRSMRAAWRRVSQLR